MGTEKMDITDFGNVGVIDGGIDRKMMDAAIRRNYNCRSVNRLLLAG
jgi:hypothetical protein